MDGGGAIVWRVVSQGEGLIQGYLSRGKILGGNSPVVVRGESFGDKFSRGTGDKSLWSTCPVGNFMD